MKNEMDKVTVVVPIYKVEDDLEDCVKSIVAQSYSNLEIILVDDGSPDNCGQMADRYATRDDRIRVIHKENGGLSDARNAGIDIATGEYITFVDSDDKIEKDFVSTLLGLIKKYNTEIAVCRNSVFSKLMGEKVSHKSDDIEICFENMDAIKHMLYQKEFDVSAWGKLYKRSTFAGIRYPKGLNFEDIPTTYKTMLTAKKVVYVGKELYHYQVRDNSIENEKFSLKKMDGIKTGEMMYLDIIGNYPQLIKAARSRYVAVNFHILAQIDCEIPEKVEIINNVKKERLLVIKDKEATIRVRMACLLTYFGFGLTVGVLNKMNSHKYFK